MLVIYRRAAVCLYKTQVYLMNDILVKYYKVIAVHNTCFWKHLFSEPLHGNDQEITDM